MCLRPHVCPRACSAGDIWPYLSPPLYMLNCVFGLMFVPLPAQQVIYDLILVPPVCSTVSSASCLSPCLLSRWYMTLSYSPLYAQLCLRPYVRPPACSAGDIWPHRSPPCMLNCVFGLMFVPLPAQQVIYDLILFPPVCSTVSSALCSSPCLLSRWYMTSS